MKFDLCPLLVYVMLITRAVAIGSYTRELLYAPRGVAPFAEKVKKVSCLCVVREPPGCVKLA